MLSSDRRFDIDALRVLLLGLLILFHVGALYTGWDWFLSSQYQSRWIAYLSAPLHLWRMSLLFFISGLAINFMRRDSNGGGCEILRLRSTRLLIPLFFGTLFLVPIQPYCQAVWHHRIEPGFLRFLADYYRLKPWANGTFYGAEDRLATGQLWYLLYLWLYTAALVLILPLLDGGSGQRMRHWLCSLRGAALLLIPALPKIFALFVLSQRFAGRDMLVEDWSHHVSYFSFFLLGHLVATDEGFWSELVRLRTFALAVAVILWPVCVLAGKQADHALAGNAAVPLLADILAAVDTWAWVAAVLGWAATLLNRPFKWLPYASDAIIPWYMLHQSIIVGVAFVLVPMKLGPLLEPLLVIAATVAGCGLSHEFFIRRHTLLRLLFGMKERRARSRVVPLIIAGSESPQPAGTSAD